MDNASSRPSSRNKFKLILGAGAACLVTGALISFTVIGLPLGLPLVVAGGILIAVSPAFKVKQMVRSRQNAPRGDGE